LSSGVVPRDDRDCGSTLPFLGVCIPDGVLDPLRFRLVGAGLADPDGVLVEPFALVADGVPTDSRDGLEGVVDVVTRRVGIRVCVPSSLLFSDKLDPCLEPLALKGLELGFELPREPPGVIPVLTPADDFLGVYPRPKLLSLSLNESGVEADNEDRDGRDMAMDLDERSRTLIIGPWVGIGDPL